MPKDFDELKEKDLKFTIGGETFEWRYVRPEVLSSWEDEKPDATATEALKHIDERIMLFLGENGDRDRWMKLREREEDPVTTGQLNGLLMWLIEVQTGRPTQTPSPSGSGRGRTAASSKAG